MHQTFFLGVGHIRLSSWGWGISDFLLGGGAYQTFFLGAGGANQTFLILGGGAREMTLVHETIVKCIRSL